MSLQLRLEALVAAVGADIKSLTSQLSPSPVTTIDGGATPSEPQTGGSVSTLAGAANQRTGMAVNELGTVQTITTTSTTIPSTSISLPSIPRPQILTGRASVKCSTAMTATAGTIANVTLAIVDDLGGILEASMVTFEAATTNGWITVTVHGDLEANAAARTYHLEVSRGGSTSGAFIVLNGSIAPGFRTVLRAVAA